jgi:outer membrane protein TolC
MLAPATADRTHAAGRRRPRLPTAKNPEPAMRTQWIRMTAWAALACCGCQPLVRWADRDVATAIAERQRAALSYEQPAPLAGAEKNLARPSREAYEYVPSPTRVEIPPGFEGGEEVPAPPQRRGETPTESGPGGAGPADPAPTSAAPTRFCREPFTLTSALAYAQQHRREYQAAREDLYLAALRLTLERHLWTPQLAAEFRTVYGNYGEARDFDQAMRFVADLSAAQRLPLGGRLTAQAISTLIRDVGHSITASEGSTINLGLEIPLLRGAGHVSREQLIQLERGLTYAVRDFERFRRQQLVIVARQYFDLLRSKQEVLDAEESVRNARYDYERARAMEEAAVGGEAASPLDTRRAEQRLLSEEARAEQVRESFRLATDLFKLEIGMPVDEAIGLEDLETIEDIERKIATGEYPLLRRPPAAGDEVLALEVATRRRLDLLNARDQIDDARRGVDIARNALLPDLNWNSSLFFDTDPNHYNVGAFEWARANWRTEMILAMNDRFQQRNELRASLIDVQRAQRTFQERLEQIRVEVRRAVNQIRLQDRVLELQKRNEEVAALRSEYARIRFEDGEISNRDIVEAQDELVRARNALNLAKTAGWSAVLEFRLATETLRVDEAGNQFDDAAIR